MISRLTDKQKKLQKSGNEKAGAMKKQNREIGQDISSAEIKTFDKLKNAKTKEKPDAE